MAVRKQSQLEVKASPHLAPPRSSKSGFLESSGGNQEKRASRTQQGIHVPVAERFQSVCVCGTIMDSNPSRGVAVTLTCLGTSLGSRSEVDIEGTSRERHRAAIARWIPSRVVWSDLVEKTRALRGQGGWGCPRTQGELRESRKKIES